MKIDGKMDFKEYLVLRQIHCGGSYRSPTLLKY